MNRSKKKMDKTRKKRIAKTGGRGRKADRVGERRRVLGVKLMQERDVEEREKGE